MPTVANFTDKYKRLPRPGNILEANRDQQIVFQNFAHSINDLSLMHWNSRKAAGLKLTEHLRTFFPDNQEVATGLNQMKRKFEDDLANSNEGKSILESMAATVQLLKKLDPQSQSPDKLSQEQWNKLIVSIGPYFNFECDQGTTSKWQEIVQKVSMAKTSSLEGLVYQNKITQIQGIFKEAVNLLRINGNLRNAGINIDDNTDLAAINLRLPGEIITEQQLQDMIKLQNIGLSSSGNLNCYGGEMWEVHDVAYLQRLVSQDYGLDPNIGNDDHYLQMRYNQGSYRNKALNLLGMKFQEKETFGNLLNILAIDPLPTIGTLSQVFDPTKYNDFSEAWSTAIDNLGLKNNAFIWGDVNQGIDDGAFVPHFCYQRDNYTIDYKTNAAALARLKVIQALAKEDYISGEAAVLASPNVEKLINIAEGCYEEGREIRSIDQQYRVNIGNKFSSLNDILTTINQGIVQGKFAPQHRQNMQNNLHSLYLTLTKIEEEISRRVEENKLSLEQKYQLFSAINQTKSLTGIDITEIRNIRNQDSFQKTLANVSTSNMVRLIVKHLESLPEEERQVFSYNTLYFLPLEMKIKLREVAEKFDQRIKAANEEDVALQKWYNKASQGLSDLVDIFLNCIYNLIGKGVHSDDIVAFFDNMTQIENKAQDIGFAEQVVQERQMFKVDQGLIIA